MKPRTYHSQGKLHDQMDSNGVLDYSKTKSNSQKEVDEVEGNHIAKMYTLKINELE